MSVNCFTLTDVILDHPLADVTLLVDVTLDPRLALLLVDVMTAMTAIVPLPADVMMGPPLADLVPLLLVHLTGLFL